MIQVEYFSLTSGENVASQWTEQVQIDLNWISREKEYTVSTVTITHNPEYPTPTISVVAPAPGIPLRVFDSEGALLFSTKKGEEIE